MASKMLFTSNGNIIDSQNIRTTTTTFATQNKRLTDKPKEKLCIFTFDCVKQKKYP